MGYSINIKKSVEKISEREANRNFGSVGERKSI